MKKFVLFFVFLFAAMTAAGNALAGEIAWLYLQHREYGGGAGLNRLSLKHPMRARASIDIYSDERYAGYFSVMIPVHVGFVFVPRDVVHKINQKGNRIDVMISLETRDKNNRTYSKKRTVNQKLPPS